MSEQARNAVGQDPSLVRLSRVELMLSRLLRTGVTVSILLVITGTVVTFVRHGGWDAATAEASGTGGGWMRPDAALAELVKFQNVPPFPHTLRGLGQSLGEGQGRGIIMLGLLVLIATPVLRVAVSIVAFVLDGDRRFVVITSVVLALLLLSFFLGSAGG